MSSLPTESVTVEEYRDDGSVVTSVVQLPYDPARRAAIVDLLTAHTALMNNANVPLVMKAWATRLLRVLRLVIDDVRES